MPSNYEKLREELEHLAWWNERLGELEASRAQIDADISTAKSEVLTRKKQADELIANWEDDW